MFYRVELLFILLRVTQHVLQTAMPKCQVTVERCYDFVERMASPIVSDSDLETILLQFCCAFPTDESIHAHAKLLTEVWCKREMHHPAAFLEMTSLISCLRTAPNTQRNQNGICQSILDKLEQFHKNSGARRCILFTEHHLNLPARVRRNQDSPLFWYQCLLGRIAQISLNRQGDCPATYDGSNSRLGFRHWDPATSDLLEGVERLPPGLPMCLLSNSHKRVLSGLCVPKENMPHQCIEGV